MKLGLLIQKLLAVQGEHFLASRCSGSGQLPEEADVVIEYWDKHGFHGLVENFDVTLNVNNKVEISPNG